MRRSRRDGLVEGERVRVTGTYVAHWERPRFEVRLPGPGGLRRRTLCELDVRPGIAPDVFSAAGVAQPSVAEQRQSAGMSFTVVAEVTPIERGHFGHLGTLRWRLRVDEWISVEARRR